jgi:predicted 3-demethylubiquinone-9 3-methyltransferase (glyoxalase superfamily)
MPHRIAPILMFDGVAERAMTRYVSLFRNSAITRIERYGADEGVEGIKRGQFSLGGREFLCFDSPAKHDFTFTPSLSIWVDCENEAELDAVYAGLSTGGHVLMPLGDYGFSARFGWVNDSFGVSWQLNLE